MGPARASLSPSPSVLPQACRAPRAWHLRRTLKAKGKGLAGLWGGAAEGSPGGPGGAHPLHGGGRVREQPSHVPASCHVLSGQWLHWGPGQRHLANDTRTLEQPPLTPSHL